MVYNVLFGANLEIGLGSCQWLCWRAQNQYEGRPISEPRRTSELHMLQHSILLVVRVIAMTCQWNPWVIRDEAGMRAGWGCSCVGELSKGEAEEKRQSVMA